MTVDELFNKNFNVPRTPRSSEYMEGVRAALAFRLNAVRIAQPYRTGTAKADAYFSGIDEGHRIWREASKAAEPSQ